MRPQDQPLSLDNLRWLLAAMALVLAPLALHLTPWVPVFALLLGFWRHQIALKQRPLPRWPVMLPLTLLGAAAIVASYHGSIGRDSCVALLTLMLALKLLESGKRRDGMLLISLSWFLAITTFLFTQSLLMGAYLALPVAALTVAMIGISHPNGMLPAGYRLRMAGRMLGLALPVMLVLFLLFPRLSGPLWRMPSDATQGMTGLSESMSPGSISELSVSDETVFRAEFTGGQLPATNQRYWRGPVFWHYDGRTWRQGARAPALPMPQLDRTVDSLDYTVTLEPHNRTWLFALDMPDAAPQDGTLRNDRLLVARQPVHQRIRYAMRSHLSYRLQPELDPATRQYALQLPADFNPRTRELAADWAKSSDGSEAIVRKALAMFREQPFVYTLLPPALGADGVDEFLFDVRRGFCEHYAGSFVFLMRAAGVPARVVTGYLGGIVNPLGSYMIVRQSDAHAWAEVWLEDRGWVRIDPTAAVAPERVESGLGALSGDEPVPLLARGENTWLQHVYLGWDALNNGWNQWVLGYNQQRQMQLLAQFFRQGISMQTLALALIGVMVAIMLAISWLLLRPQSGQQDKLENAYRVFVRKLAGLGITREAHEGPLALGERAATALPEAAESIMMISRRYAALRYGALPMTHQQYDQLKREIRDFKA